MLTMRVLRRLYVPTLAVMNSPYSILLEMVYAVVLGLEVIGYKTPMEISYPVLLAVNLAPQKP